MSISVYNQQTHAASCDAPTYLDSDTTIKTERQFRNVDILSYPAGLFGRRRNHRS